VNRVPRSWLHGRGRLAQHESLEKARFSGVVMKKLIREPAAATRPDHLAAAGAAGLSYRRCAGALPHALFAAPPVDLHTLVIAEALKRKAQAEIRRDVLRDALYEMPVSSGRNNDRDRDAQIRPYDPED
jgi:hypothetical protein